MDEPAVSIVMAVRNGERFLPRALDSIAAQSFTDYEVIVIDGNSTDDSVNIARRYSRIRCIQQTGSGFMSAWNQGIKLSASPFIAFLDSDDFWSPDKLRAQILYFSEHPQTDYVIGRVRFFLQDGIKPPPGFRPMLLEGSHLAYTPGTSLIRREVFSNFGLFEDRWTIASDLVWFAKLKEFGIKVGVVDDVLLHKCVHGGNLSYTTPKETYQRELTRFLKESLDRRKTTGTLS